MNRATRIEAWRLLARCCGACRALKSAVSEAKAAGYVWIEATAAAALHDMVQWAGGDGSTGLRQEEGADLQQLQARIDTLSAGFLL